MRKILALCFVVSVAIAAWIACPRGKLVKCYDDVAIGMTWQQAAEHFPINELPDNTEYLRRVDTGETLSRTVLRHGNYELFLDFSFGWGLIKLESKVLLYKIPVVNRWVTLSKEQRP